MWADIPHVAITVNPIYCRNSKSFKNQIGLRIPVGCARRFQGGWRSTSSYWTPASSQGATAEHLWGQTGKKSIRYAGRLGRLSCAEIRRKRFWPEILDRFMPIFLRFLPKF